MNPEQLTALGLTEEQVTKVTEAWEQELQNYKPVADYTTLETEKQGLETQISTYETNMKSLLKDAKGNTLEEQIGNFLTSIETERINLQQQLEQQRFEHCLEKALASAKARNPKAVKALLDLEKIKLDANGSMTGLDEQLTPIKDSDAYLFAEEATGGTGDVGNFKRQKHDTPINPWAKDTFNLTEQGKLFKENPELAESLKTQAGAN